MKIRILSVLFCLFFSLVMNAEEEENLGKLLTASTNGNYIGQYTDNHKKKSGTGIDKAGDGVYIGDFKDNKYNGRGMLIRGVKTEIKNAPDAYVYVGGWINGKKQGKGICYAPNGDIIYQGKFEDDKPVDAYPSEDVNEMRYFSFIEMEDGMFVGEVTQGLPDGFGLFVNQDGTYWIGNYDDGDRKGVAIFLYGPDAWSQVNYKNGECVEINSSEIYNSRRQAFKEASDRFKAEMWNQFLDIATGLASVGSEFVSQKYGSSSSSSATADSASSDTGSSNSSKKSSSSSKKSGDCGTAWMSDSRAYSNYETLLATGKADPSDVQNIKSKMRKIRQKWEQRGCPITKSSYES